MSSNVGLTTPRGSGTSGYVQRNISHLKPRDASTFAPYPTDLPSHKPRKPDANILNHDRLREIEVQVFELQEKLEDEGELGDEEIEERAGELREKLMAQGKSAGGGGGAAGGEGKGRKQFKTHQVHEQAEAKIKEDERLRKALGIRSDYEEGSHWRRNEERLREGLGSNQREER